jgi:hypothetical protein
MYGPEVLRPSSKAPARWVQDKFLECKIEKLKFKAVEFCVF